MERNTKVRSIKEESRDSIRAYTEESWQVALLKPLVASRPCVLIKQQYSKEDTRRVMANFCYYCQFPNNNEQSAHVAFLFVDARLDPLFKLSQVQIPSS